MIRGKLSVVLPAHNEVQNLPAVIDRGLAVLPEIVDTFELIIVDDGSHDGTRELADQLASQHREVIVVHHDRNRGYGAALTSGFAVADGDYIMFMDSDQQFDIADLTYLAPMVGRYDIVAGYRINRRDARYRIIYAEVFKLAMRILFGIRLRDIDCAFKLFRADLLKSAALESPGALINTEILAKAKREGATWVEVGVNHYPRSSGESSGGSPKVVLRAMKETVLLWLRMRHYVPRATTAPKPGFRAGTGLILLLWVGLIVIFGTGLSNWLKRRQG